MKLGKQKLEKDSSIEKTTNELRDKSTLGIKIQEQSISMLPFANKMAWSKKELQKAAYHEIENILKENYKVKKIKGNKSRHVARSNY